jgi:DNA transformation protein and related proteins
VSTEGRARKDRSEEVVGAVSVERLRGLGPKSSAALRAIGIDSADELRARDPFEVYAELKAKVPGTSLNFLYGLIGAVEDVSWQEVKRTRRTAILLRLEEMGLAPK